MESGYDFVLGFLGVMGYNGVMIIYFNDSRLSENIVLLPLLDVFTEKENDQGRKEKSKMVHMDHKLSTPPQILKSSYLHLKSSLGPHISFIPS